MQNQQINGEMNTQDKRKKEKRNKSTETETYGGNEALCWYVG